MTAAEACLGSAGPEGSAPRNSSRRCPAPPGLGGSCSRERLSDLAGWSLSVNSCFCVFCVFLLKHARDPGSGIRRPAAPGRRRSGEWRASKRMRACLRSECNARVEVWPEPREGGCSTRFFSCSFSFSLSFCGQPPQLGPAFSQSSARPIPACGSKRCRVNVCAAAFST
jgi:hypothetical protein